MTNSHHTIFRTQAMKHYIHRQDKDVLPRLVSPPVLVFCWILLALLLSAGVITWWGEIPTHVAGSRIKLVQGPHSIPGRTEVLIFLPANQPLRLDIGSPIQLQIGMTGPRFTGQLEKFELGIISTAEAYICYPLGRSVIQVISQLSAVLIVRVGPPFSSYAYAGSIVRAQVPTGSRRVLSLSCQVK